VTVTGLTLSGAHAGDYILAQPTATANITPAPLTITATANTQPFDGTATAAAIPTVAGLQGTDTVTGLTEAYADSLPGKNKPLVVTGYTVNDGNGGHNYIVSTVANTTGVITVLAHFTVIAPPTATPGGPINFTVTAIDQFNNPFGGAYTGTVHFSSSDGYATLPGDTTLTSGTGIFSATLNSQGFQTISAIDTITSGIVGTSNVIAVSAAATHFVISAPSAATAGTPFLVTVTAQDDHGHIATNYSGTIHFSTSGGSPILPADATLSGGGNFLVTLRSAGTFSVTAQDTTSPALSGASGAIPVSPAAASYFTLTPAAAVTGTPFPVTVTALDPFGNTATSYSGTVHFTSSDAAAALPADAALSSGSGVFQVTLKTAGSQTITATDAAATTPLITGTSPAITTRGLVVNTFTPNATGFTATFNKPILPADLALWGGTVAKPIQNVTLVGAKNGAINGSLVVTNTSITFKASAVFLSSFFQTAVLPDDVYTVTLTSGSNASGFVDALGAGLDGSGNGGHADYTTTFTVANAGKGVLSIPDFARGPDGGHAIKVPNDSAAGIPVTLANAVAVNDIVFTLSYNPALFSPTGAGIGDASAAGSSFTMGNITNIDATHATVTFSYHNSTAQRGTVVLGDILANVPSSAANLYRAKEILGLSAITVNGTAFSGVWANGPDPTLSLGQPRRQGDKLQLLVSLSPCLLV
jgi:hypothetical protein